MATTKEAVIAPEPHQAEDLEHAATHGTYLDKDEASHLSPEHREYLLQRHGTLDLDPLPTPSDADPYNWPTWKKVMNLTFVAFHAMMCVFSASAIIPAYENIAEDLGVSLQRTSYLTSLQIAVLNSPLFWRPLATRFGRRPIFIISLIGSMAFNIGAAESHSYGTMAACRAMQAFFISPPVGVGSAVVVETFFKHERARFMGIWTVMITLGIPLAPFIMGFVTQHTGNYRWIYWLLAIINGTQLILYTLFGPETRFIRHPTDSSAENPNLHVKTGTAAWKDQYLRFRRIDATPISLLEFVSPLRFIKYPCIFIPAFAYSVVFMTQVLVTVEIPQLFAQKFHFGPQPLGLQFLSIIIGSIIGEQLAGHSSDLWMRWKARRNAEMGKPAPEPEFRLWLSYIGIILTAVGMVVFLVRIEQAAPMHWNVTPLIGAGIAATGNQIITTVATTYAVDCYPGEAGSIGVFISVVRQTIGFIGPFWFPQMFESVGVAKSAGIIAGLVMGLSFFPMIFVQWRGHRMRGHMSGRL